MAEWESHETEKASEMGHTQVRIQVEVRNALKNLTHTQNTENTQPSNAVQLDHVTVTG